MEWSNSWMMPLNSTKCKVLHLGHKNRGFPYFMDGVPLDNTSLERDLGVQFDAELKFREQAASAVAKATKILAVMK